MRVFKRRRLVKRGLTTAVKRVSGERHPVLDFFERGVVPRTVTALLLLAAITFIVAKPGGYVRQLSLGETAKQTIIATTAFKYEDDAKRQLMMDKARATVPAISRLDEAKIAGGFEAYDKFFGEAAEVNEAAEGAEDAKEQRRRLVQKAEGLFPRLDSDQLSGLISDPAYADRLKKLRQVLLGLAAVRTFHGEGYRPPGLEFDCISAEAFERRLDMEVAKAFAEEDAEVVAALKVIANDATAFQDDVQTTSLLRDRLAADVPLQYTEVPRLATIISKDEKATPVHIAKLQAFDKALRAEVSRKTRYSYRASVAVATALLLGLGGLYLWRFEPRVFRQNSRLVLISVVSLIALGLTKAIEQADLASWWWPDVLKFPVLIALPAMVVAMAFTVRLAFLVTLVLSILSGIHYDVTTAGMTMHPMFVLLGIVEGSAAALYARAIRHRKGFIRAGAVIGLLNFMVVAVEGMLAGQDVGVLLLRSVGGLGAGVLATTLAWLLLPTLEYLFHMTTNISLVELGDSDHPLLRRMVMEAPGTYHHSLIVGNLSEAAAEAIGGNPLLARVGALYHDIGKLKKPDYFSENEQHARSRHDTLIPSMSSLIITSHVKDGIDLGVKYRLKPALLDIIREHHGTSLVYYFYKRAEQMNGDAAVDEADFRYPGPKPTSKEAAIIMLADAVEAAARAMEKPTAGKIRALVRELVLARLNDGQLDESELTLRDLHRIQEAFIHIILGTLHQRVKYPKEGEPSEDEPTEDEAPEPEPTGAENRSH